MNETKQNNQEFDTAEIFRKLTSKSNPTNLQSVQAYFDEIDRKRNFIRELGQLCLKYGVGGITELEYDFDPIGSQERVTVHMVIGTLLLDVSRESIDTIAQDIFKAVG